MSTRRSLPRRILIWVGPLVAIVLLTISGFLYWMVATTPGVRWALVMATRGMGGTVSGVQGNVWTGLTIGHLHLPLDGTDVQADDVHLQVEWRDLLQRKLHIREFAAGQLHIDLAAGDEPKPESDALQIPALPVQVQVDHLALGELVIAHDNVPIPVTVRDLDLSLDLAGDDGRVALRGVNVGASGVDARVDGDFRLLGLGEPWPFEAAFKVSAQGLDEDSLLCAHHWWDALPLADDSEPDCALEADMTVNGSLQDMDARVQARGQGMMLDAVAQLTPQAAFPLKDARVDLTLADASSLHAEVDWSPGSGPGSDHVTGRIRATQLDVGKLAGGALPPAVLTTHGDFSVDLQDRTRVTAAQVDLAFEEPSSWNEQPLSGTVRAAVQSSDPDWLDLRVHDADIDVRLGKNAIVLAGALGAPGDELALDVTAPALASFWPGLPGGVTAKGTLAGGMAAHQVDITGRYVPEAAREGVPGEAPFELQLKAHGAWHADAGADTEPAGRWDGTIDALDGRHAGLDVTLAAPVTVRAAPHAQGDQPLWQVGATSVAIALKGRPLATITHDGSQGSAGGHWASAGRIPEIILNQAVVNDVRQWLQPDKPVANAAAADARGGVKVQGARRFSDLEITLALDWNLRFEQALAGTLAVHRVAGDLLVPSEPPFPLGLETLSLELQAQPAGPGVSMLAADLNVATRRMGRASASARTRVHVAGAPGLDPAEPISASLRADIESLGWVSLFTGDDMEFGGNVVADLQARGSLAGPWDSSGTIDGSELRIIRIDDGVRLLDGRLHARLENDQLILDELYFPARLRVEPKEWRTAEWVSTNPDARDGYARATGNWSLSDMAGQVAVELHRYPVLQRADRYAMVTGTLQLDAPLPALSITGDITADAGWIDLDMLGGLVSVDGDVVVVRAGEELGEPDVPMDISMDIGVDLGPRFYLTGFGVNSGLVGDMRIVMVDNKITGLGALRTRGGAIETYGQRLQLRRGTLTFQGDITNPVLDIEALRTGLAVEAGVRVGGTAKRPRIDLVSYPDVSEIEKLSWLLFGHGPDESGGDMALLVSVGTSFLGDGEPFYRRFGIDEISLRSGELGSAGSILPVESVVSGLNSGTSDLERQFISVSKGISRGFTVSVRQALSDTGTVGHITYELARGLTAELSVGTTNGLALIYRWFSRD